jgi:hypothetical protein
VRFEVLTEADMDGYALITLMMKAASTSEASVNFYQTTPRNNLEDSHLYYHYN